MAVFAEVDGRRRGLGPRVEAMFPNEVIMRDSIYTRGRDEGIALGRDEGIALGRDKGIAPLLRVVSRRLGRDLRPEERSALARHIETPEGAARLGDLVIDLSPADLSAWLADPDA